MSLEETLSSFSANLDDVEAALEPLLARPLQDTLNDLSGPAERAKLLFWIAYAVHSCSWMYTKLKAVDPEEHGVMDELKRIQGYNGKILSVTKSDAAKKADERNTRIDKGAADRFIKAAISNQPKAPDASSSFYSASASVSDPLRDGDGPGQHSRLSTFKRQEEMSSGSSSESEDLVVEDGDLADENEEKKEQKRPKSAKAEERKRKWDTDGMEIVEESPPASNKPAVVQDPLQCYAPESSKKSKKEKKKKKSKKLATLQHAAAAEAESSSAAAPSSAVSSTASTPLGGSANVSENEDNSGNAENGSVSARKKRRKEKKAAKRAAGSALAPEA